MNRINQQVAGRLEEAARLLQDQGADRFRVGAYLRAASASGPCTSRWTTYFGIAASTG